jgi:uncharacterized RDD family membrane protein YckC
MSTPVNIPPAALAPLSKRFLNFFIDSILCYAFTWGLSFLGEYLLRAYGFDGLQIGAPVLGNARFTMANMAITIAYYGLFETLISRTPGKFVTDTRVVMRDSEKPGNTAILIRTLCRQIPLEFISFIPVFGKLPIGWHDTFSKTLVVDNYAFEMAKRKANDVSKPSEEL